MNFGPARIEMISATSVATRTRGHYARAATLAATASRPTAREPFTSTTSPGRSTLASSVDRRGRRSAPTDGVAGAVEVAARELADGDELVDAELAAASPTSRW